MRIFGLLLTVLLVIACSFTLAYSAAPSPGKGGELFSMGKKYDYENILVKRVVDGDTLVLENEEWVRLIGIDTPEIHETQKLYRDAVRTKQDVRVIKAMGMEASNFTKKLVDRRKVKLEFDAERKDKYGRLLAYVYLQNGTFVNAEIIGNGYASPMTIPPNVKYAELFRSLYAEARENRKGLWGGK
jgi:micrococcal nuclease